jgi:peptidoglycan/xylan/chitin deacetylase (PgdA/CDA1 family)
MAKNLLFRNDDVCVGCDVKKFIEVRSIFEEFGIKEHYSVIPFGRNIYTPNAHLLSKDELNNYLGLDKITTDPEACEFIRDSLKRGHEITLHGWNHVLVTDYSLKEQILNIRIAKEFLEDTFGVRIEYFVPPFNSYEDDTITACKENNLHILGRNMNQLEWLVDKDDDFTGDDHCWYHAWRFEDANKLRQWLLKHYNQPKS